MKEVGGEGGDIRGGKDGVQRKVVNVAEFLEEVGWVPKEADPL